MNNLLEMFGVPSRFKEENVHFNDDLVTVSGEVSTLQQRPPYKGACKIVYFVKGVGWGVVD